MTAAKQKTRNRAPKGQATKPKRKLVRWSDSMDKRLLLAIQYVANERAIVLPWDTIGEHLDVSPGAISQHLAKLRHRLVDWGFTVPPPLRRGGNNAIQGPKSRAAASRRSNARKDYESDGYENEDYEDQDWKEEEYGEEESDIPMSEARAIKKNSGKAIGEYNGDSEEDIKPRIRTQLRQRPSQKPVRTENGEPYTPPRIGDRSHPRRHPPIEAAAVAQASRSSRLISPPGRHVSPDVDMISTEDGNEFLKHADVAEMFSEFSRPARTSKAGLPKVGSMSADPGYERPGRQQTGGLSLNQDDSSPYDTPNDAEPGDIFSRGMGNGLFADHGKNDLYSVGDIPEESRDRLPGEFWGSPFDRQGDSNLLGADNVPQPRNRLPREAVSGLLAYQSDGSYNIRDSAERGDGFPKEVENGHPFSHTQDQLAPAQQILAIPVPVHSASPPATPKNRIPLNPYADSTITPYESSSVGSTLDDSGRNITPIARVATQHQRVPSFLSQPNDTSLNEPLYQALYPYPQFGAFDESPNAVKREPRSDGSNGPGLQPRADGEHHQYNGLHASSEEGVDSLSSLDFDFDNFLIPNGIGDTMDDFDSAL